MLLLVSIILGSYNRRAFLKAALDSVRANGMDFPYEIIVVDGGSTDGSLKYLAEQKDVITIIQHNRGEFRGKKIERRSWGYFMNLAFKAAQGKYILMISDDSLLVPGAVKTGVEGFEKKLAAGEKLGALAFYWRNTPEVKRYSVMKFSGRIFVNHGLYLRSALEEVRWIDEFTYRFYGADIDLCLRLEQAGYQTGSCPNAVVEHYAVHEELARLDNMKEAQSNGDVRNLINRWRKVYGYAEDATLQDLVSFDYLDYVDPHETARKFPKVYRSPFQIAKKLFFKIMRLRNGAFDKG
jgi:GT2 family glycosyltransferase